MPAAPHPKSWRRDAGFIALVVIVAFACYWPALSGAMLWDDPAHVPRPELRTLEGLGRIWTDVRATQQYYPVLFSSFWLQHRLWGDTMTGYHVVNVLEHAASCLVLAFLLRRLWTTPATADVPAARTVPAGAEWLAALLFAVHPIAVESVAWVTEQKNTLSLFWYLLAAYLYLGFARDRRAASYGLATACFLLALGSKTATVTLPAALLVVQWWQQGRLRWRADVLPLLPWFVASAAIGGLTSWVERKVIGAEGAAFALDLGQRTLLAGRIVWFYAGKLLWPADLMFFYPRWPAPTPTVAWLAGVAAAAGVTFALWLLRRRTRAPLAVWLLFVGGLAPVLGFFNVFFFQFSYVNDHFVYLACLAPLALAASGLAQAVVAAPSWLRPAALLGVGLLVAALGVRSFRQSGLYRNNETLFRHAIAHNPDTWMGHYILGFTLAKTPEGRSEARAEFAEAIRLNPDYADAHLSLGVELARLPGRSADAIASYRRALALRPQYVEAHNALGVELARQPATLAEAIQHYETALALQPQFADAHFNLANALAPRPDRAADAARHYEEALRLNPVFARAHVAYAFLLSRQPERTADALAHYETALRLQPDFPEAYNGLGILYAQLGQPDRARAQWEAALRLAPNFESARRNLRLLEQNSPR